MSNEKPTSPMFQATSMMLEAMRDLKEKKISPQEANSIALLGKGITDMAREATNFVRATGMIPTDSAFGSTFRDIEPKVSREALAEQKARLEAKGCTLLSSNRASGEF